MNNAENRPLNINIKIFQNFFISYAISVIFLLRSTEQRNISK